MKQTDARRFGTVTIGLVNNMPDTVLHRTEQQFFDLLAHAGGGRSLRIRLFSLPQIRRKDAVRADMLSRYEPIEALWDSRLDGLIVTGAPPRHATLEEEPFWPILTRLVDWAEENTAVSFWSCLAAHVAVRHLDGIGRVLLPSKLSGVFPCDRAGHHHLLHGLPTRWRIPHSRYNGLREPDLVSCDYHILSRGPDAGVDMFMRQRRSLFVFSQGHPEYDPGALLREYSRDFRRYVAGNANCPPTPPKGSVDGTTTATLAELGDCAALERSPELLQRLDVALEGAHVAHDWRGVAGIIFANWLDCVEASGDAADRRAVSPSQLNGQNVAI